jgi:BASS family bile acid:Na+ symporter
MSLSAIQQVVEIGVAPVAFLLMLVVGLSLELPVLTGSLRPFHRLSVDLLLVVVLPPIAALLAVLVLRPPGETAAAILLIAACPIGDIANAYTLLARGSAARALTLNGLTAVLAPVSMGLIFSAYSQFGFEHRLLAVPPGELALRLAAFLLLPVSVGMMLRHRMPRFATRIIPAVTRLTTVGILLLLALVLANPISRPDNIPQTIAISALFLAICITLGSVFLPFLRRRSGEKTALALCIPVRNVGIAALIAVSLLGQTRMAGVAAVYFALEVALFLPFAIWLGRRSANSSSSRFFAATPSSASLSSVMNSDATAERERSFM